MKSTLYSRSSRKTARSRHAKPVLSGSIGALLTCALIPTAHAATATWTTSGSSALDGSGTWDAVTANWTTTGTSSAAWNPGNTAVFGAGTGGSYAVSLSGSSSVGGLTFNALPSGGYTLTGGTLGLGAATTTFTVNNATTIGSAIQGTNTLTLAGTSILTLTGSNSYTGLTTVSSGTLQIGAGGTTGSIWASSGIAVASGATLAFNRTDNYGANFTQAISGAGAVAINSGTLTISGGGNTAVTNTVAVNNGGTLVLARNDTWGSAATTTSAAVTVNAGGTLASSNSFTTLWNATLNGGTVLLNGGVNGSYPAFQFAGTLTATGTSSVTVGTGSYNILNIGGAGNGTLTVNTPNLTDRFTINSPLQTSGSLTKSGSGTLTLAGLNTYTGATTVTAGVLTLDYSTQNNSKLSDTGALTLGGGTVNLNGGTHTEVVLSTTLAAANSFVTRGSGAAVLQMGTITRSVGGAIDFGAPNIATTNNTNVNGILGNWATVNGTDWAVNSTNAAGGPIIALASYTASLVGTTVPGASADVDFQAGNVTPWNTQSINTLRFNTAAANTLTLNSGQTLTVNSGGILVSAAVGNNASSITGGNLQGTAGGELAISQNNTSSGLTIGSSIQDNGGATGLTKYGSGTLTLSGSNSFSGTTTIVSGVLNLNNANAVLNSTVTATGTNALAFSSGIGSFNLGGLASGTTTRIALTDAASQPITLTVGGNNASTTFGGGLTGSGTLVKVGNGTLALNPNLPSSGVGSSTYSGGTVIKSGTVKFGTYNSNSITNLLGSGTITLGDTAGSATATLVSEYGSYNLGNPIVIQSGNSGTSMIQNNGGVLTINGVITLGSANSAGHGVTLSGVSTGSLTLSGTIQDPVGMTPGTAGTVTINTPNTVTLNAANTYTGPTVVAAGILKLNSAGGIQNSASVTGSTGSTIQLPGGFSFATPLTLSGTGASGQTGALVNTGGYNAWAAAITLNGAARISSDSGAFIAANTISGNTTLTLAGAGNGTIVGAVALGSGTLSKAGAGVWSLSGANTVGAVDLSGGTFAVSSDASLGGGATPINFNGGTLRVEGVTLSSLSAHTINWSSGGFEIKDSANNFTVGQALSGTGGFTKLGAGALTLNGTAANTYSGATNVNGGTLALDFTNLATPSNLIGSSSVLNFGGGALSIKASETGSTSQTINGVTFNSGGGSVLVNPNNGAGTTVALGTITGTAAGGSLLIGTASGAGTGTVTLTTGGAKNATTGIYGGRVVFTDGSNYDWAGSSSGSAPYTLGAYSGYTALSVTGSDTNNSRITANLTLTGSVNTNTLKIEAPAAGQSLALGGTTLSLTGGGLLATGTNAFTISGGTLTGGNGAGAYDLVIQQFNSGGLNISASVANSGTNVTALTKAGSGTLALTGSLAATGNVAVNAGRLTLATGSYPIATGAARTISIATGASLELSATAGTSFLPADSGQALTLSGNGTLVKTGTGIMVLANTNTFGTLAMSAGSLIDVQGGTLQASTNFHGNVSANQASINIAAGATFNGGELSISLDALTGAGTYTDGYGAVTTTLGVANGSGTFSGAVQNQLGTLSIVKVGSGTQVFSGSCTYGGSTAINGGTLQFGAGGTTGNLPTTSNVTGLAGATLAFNRSDAVVVSTIITGGLGVAKNGTGTVTLSGSNSYTGNTAISAGVLGITGTNSLPGWNTAGRYSVAAGAGLAVPNSVSDGTLASLLATGNFAIGSSLGFDTTAGTRTYGSDFGLLGSGFGLAKSGSNTLILSANNTYSGPTLIGGGTLQIGAGGTVGSIGSTSGVTVGLGAVLGFNRTDNYGGSFSTTISGLGGITLASGTLVLTGSNTYTGATTVAGGLLPLSSLSNGGVASVIGQATSAAANLVLAGGTLQYTRATVATDRGFTLGNSTTSGIEVTSAAANLTISGSSAATTGALVKTGPGTLTLTGPNAFTGVTTISSGTLQIGTGGAGGTLASTSIVNNGTLIYFKDAANADAITLPAGGITGSGALSATAGHILLAGNVNLPSGSQSYAQFGTAAQYLGNGIDVVGSNVTLTGTSITMTGDAGTQNHSANLTLDTSAVNGPINLNISLGRNGIWYGLQSGNLILNSGTGAINITGAGPAGYWTGWNAGYGAILTGAVNISGNLSSTGGLTINPTASSTVSGILSNTMTLTKGGGATLTLTNANSYSGITTINSGTLQIGAGGTTGSLGSAGVTGSSGAVLAFNRSDAVVVSNTISGSLSVAQNGIGTLTLSGSNSYTGNTAINAGALALTGTNSLPGWNTAGRYSVAAGAALTIPNTMDDTVLGPLLGTGNFAVGSCLGFDTTAGIRTYAADFGNLASGVGIAKSGTNTLILSANNTYTGPTLVTGGTLQIGTGGTAGSIGSTSSVTLASAAVLSFNRTDDYGGAFVPAIGGSGAVTIASGTLALSGSNSFSGATTLTSGTLNLNNANALQYSTLNASGSNAVQFGSGIGSFNLGGLASGTNSVRIALTDAASQPITLTVGSNNGTTTFYGGLTGSGTLVKVGTGTLTLDTKLGSNGVGAFTYSGGTYLLAGTLRYGSSGGNWVTNLLGSGTLYFGATSGSSNATLQQIYTSDTLTNNIVLQSGNTGTMTIQASGGNDVFSGTITLGSPNSAGKGLTIAGGNLSFGFNGAIQDPVGMTPGTVGTVTIAGSPVTFSAANTYTGPTVVASGVLVLNNAGAIQNSASITGSNGGTIQLPGGLSFSTPLTLSGSGASGQTGALVNNSSNNVWSGPITLAGASTISSNAGMLDLLGTISGSQNLTLAGAGWGEVLGAISIGSGTLAKAGAGVWTLNNAPGAGAVSLNAGSLSVNNTAILSGAPLNFNGGNLRITGTSVTSLSGLNANWSTFNGGLDIPSSAANIAMSQALSGTGALMKLGAGTLTLNGTAANTYSGATNVNGGTLALDFTNLATATNLIGASSALNLGGGALSINASGTGSTSQTFNGLVLNSGGGSVLVNPNGGVGTTVALGTITGTAAGCSLLVGTAPGAGTGTVTLTTAGAKNATGIYGGRVVFTDGANYDWAGSSSGSAPYTLGAYSGYSALAASGSDAGNSRLTSSASLAGSLTTNTIKIENPDASQMLDLGAGTLALTGGGLLATGSNAFTIQNGTLTGGNGAGAYDLVIQQFNSGGLNISASIANSGANVTALTKAGSGTLTLSGSLAATGNIAVNAGRLALAPGSYPIASGAARTISIATGATLELNATAGTNFLPADNGQALTISGGGTLVKTGTGSMVLANANTLGTLAMSAGSLIDVQGGTLVASTSNHGSMAGNQASINIAVGATFSGAELSVSLDALTGAGTYNDGYLAVITTLGVANGSGTFSGTVQNQQGTLSIEKVGSGTQVLTGSNTYGGTTAVNAGVLQIGAGGTTGSLPNTAISGLSGATLVFNRSDAIGIYSTVSGGLGVTQNGSGTLTIGQVASYTGPTNVNAGTLQIGSGSGGRIAASSSVTVAPGATLAIDLASTGVFGNAVTNNGTVAAIAAGVNTLSGVISGNGGFTQSGTGSTYLTAANTYTGPTVISGGTLQLGTGGTTGSIASTSGVTFGSGATLAFNRADNYGGNWSIPISGSGGVTLNTGTLTLTGSNSFSGATTMAGGILNLNNANALQYSTLSASGSNVVQFGSGIGSFNLGGLASGTGVRIALTDAASMPISLAVGGNNSSTTYSGGLTGSGTLVKVGTGTLTLDTLVGTSGTGAFTYSGGTYILCGTLKYGSSAGNAVSNKLGTGTVYLGDTTGSSNATLSEIYNSDNLPNNIVVQSGNTGVMTLFADAYQNINGTITLGSLNGSGKSLTLAGNAGGGRQQHIFGVIQDPSGMTAGTAGTVTISNPGSTTFHAANTYTGPTVVASGILILSNANAIQNSASVTGSTGSTIQLPGGCSFANPLTLSGVGASGQTGALVNTGGYNTWATSITLNGAARISSDSGTFIAGNLISGSDTLTLAGAGNGTITGAVALGSGTLGKAGAGVWSLSGANTVGAVDLSAGTLAISSDAGLGGGATPINFNGGTLRVEGVTLNSLSAHPLNWSSGGFDIKDSANNFTVGQVLSGTGGLTKIGAGTLTLNGTVANTYAGVTAINGGALALDYASVATDLVNSSSALNLGGGAVSIKANPSGATAQTFNGLTLARGGGSILVDPNNGPGTTVTLGALTATAAGSSLLVGTAPGAGTGTVAFYTNTATDATGILGARVAFADGSAAGYDWAANASPSDPLIAYAGYTAMAVTGSDSNNSRISANTTLTGSVNTNTLKIEAPATGQSLALGGTTLSLTGGGLLATGSNAFTISGGTLTAGNGTGAYELVIQQFNSGGLNISASIANSGTNATALTKAGSGTLTLSGSLAATGNVAVNAGRLVLTSQIASGAVRTISIASAGTLELNAASGTIYLPADYGQALTISGNGTLVKTGTGTMVLANGNTFGTLAMSAGSLIDVQGGTLYASTNYHGNLSGNQASVNIASGATFGCGELSISLDALTGAGTFTGGYGASAITETIGVANGSGTFTGVVNLTSVVTLLKVGTGTQVLGGSNTYTGPTTVNAGTLQIGNGTSGSIAASSPVSVGAGAVLGINLAGNGTFANGVANAGSVVMKQSGTSTLTGVLSGSGSFKQSGTGLTYLNTANSSTGPTIVTAGILRLNHANALGSGALSVNGGMLDLHGNSANVGALSGSSGGSITNTISGTSTLTTNVAGGTSTYAGGIGGGTGSVALVKQGAGTLVLSGSLGLVGITANEGSAELAQSGSIGAISIGSTGKLELSANNVNSAKVLDTSSLSIAAGGTLDLWDNALILRDPTGGVNQGANLAMVQGLVNTAFDNGAWDTTGITSSTVIADLGAYSVLTVMVYDNTVLGVDSFEGINNLQTDNGGNQVMLKTTYLGDFDGNGIVNSADYGWLDFYYGYGLTVGDLNGDGQVNSADYNGIDYGYGYQAYGVLSGGGQAASVASAAPAAAPASPVAVPEPGTFGLLLTGALALFGFRRKIERRS